VFWSSIVGALPFAMVIGVRPEGHAAFDFSFQVAIVPKSIAMTASWVFAYLAVKNVPISLAAPVRASGPIWTLLGGIAVLGEWLSAIQAVGLVVCVAAYWWFGAIGGRSGMDRRTSWIAGLLMLQATWLSAATTVYDKWLIASLGIDPWDVQTVSALQRAALAAAMFVIWRLRTRGGTAMPRAPLAVAIVGLAWVGAEAAHFAAIADEASSVTVLAVLRRVSLIVAVGVGALLFRESHLHEKVWATLFLIVGMTGLILG
jgi:bacterial/archaeal transporter family protein